MQIFTVLLTNKTQFSKLFHDQFLGFNSKYLRLATLDMQDE